jgi:small lipoprotein (TIGR04452 family)
MKKILTLVIAVVVFSNCLLLNPLGLNVGREKGSEVADRMVTAAITADLTSSALVSSLIRTNVVFISIFSLIADDIAGIEEDKYYIKSDVDACVSDIEKQGIILNTAIPVLLSCKDMKTDGYLLGSPLPKI